MYDKSPTRAPVGPFNWMWRNRLLTFVIAAAILAILSIANGGAGRTDRLGDDYRVCMTDREIAAYRTYTELAHGYTPPDRYCRWPKNDPGLR